MQILPDASVSSIHDYARDVLTSDYMNGTSFGTVLSSYIEEGRDNYTGVPEGFPALDQGSGTISRETTDLLKEELRNREVPEISILSLEEMTASGTPATIGRIFSVLSGSSRIGGELEGEDRMNFMQFLSKLGFGKDESDEILGLADEGRTKAAWSRIAAKLTELGDESVNFQKSEMAALLKAMDLTSSTQSKIAALFKGEEFTLSGSLLKDALGGIPEELAARAEATKKAVSQMRDAMSDALQAAKIKEKTDPVSDARGSRVAEQSEALMKDSFQKKTGGLKTAADAEAENGQQSEGLRRSAANARQGAEDHEDGNLGEGREKNRAERILSTRADSKDIPTDQKTASKGTEALDRMLQRIDAAAQPSTPIQAPTQSAAQDLNSMARSHRQEIFSQVENGMLQNMQNGTRQLTLQLNPENLGNITVILSVNQGEVRATIRAEQPESAAVLSEQMAELKASLESQGFKVEKLDVQTQLQDHRFAEHWNGTREHNLMHDSRERERMTRLSQLRREAGVDGTGSIKPENSSYKVETGLHVVA